MSRSTTATPPYPSCYRDGNPVGLARRSLSHLPRSHHQTYKTAPSHDHRRSVAGRRPRRRGIRRGTLPQDRKHRPERPNQQHPAIRRRQGLDQASPQPNLRVQRRPRRPQNPPQIWHLRPRLPRPRHARHLVGLARRGPPPQHRQRRRRPHQRHGHGLHHARDHRHPSPNPVARLRLGLLGPLGLFQLHAPGAARRPDALRAEQVDQRHAARRPQLEHPLRRRLQLGRQRFCRHRHRRRAHGRQPVHRVRAASLVELHARDAHGRAGGARLRDAQHDPPAEAADLFRQHQKDAGQAPLHLRSQAPRRRNLRLRLHRPRQTFHPHHLHPREPLARLLDFHHLRLRRRLQLHRHPPHRHRRHGNHPPLPPGLGGTRLLQQGPRRRRRAPDVRRRRVPVRRGGARLCDWDRSGADRDPGQDHGVRAGDAGEQDVLWRAAEQWRVGGEHLWGCGVEGGVCGF